MKLVNGVAQEASISDIVTLTRAGQATRISRNGDIRVAKNDELRYDYTNGKRQLLTEGPSTNLLRQSVTLFGPGWNIAGQGGAAANLNLNAMGLFPGVQIASGGADWHRLRSGTLPTVVSGTSYVLWAYYRAGSSKRARIVFRNGTGGVETYAAGNVGDLQLQDRAASSSAGVRNVNLGNGNFFVELRCTANFSGPVELGFGPDSIIAGKDVIVLGIS